MPITRGVAIPLAEVELRASRSSGPGGQHANVTASRVEAVFDVAASRALDERAEARGSRRGWARSCERWPRTRAARLRNRELALERLRERLAARAARPAPAPRDEADAPPRAAGGWRRSGSAATSSASGAAPSGDD